MQPRHTGYIPRPALSAWLACVGLLLAFAPQARPADRPWRVLSAPHYQLFSQADDRQTIAWAREFDQFIASMSAVLRIDPANLPPLTMVLFARDRDFTPYKLTRPNGSAADVQGQFMRLPTWSVMGLALAREDEALRQTVFHEATHWLMSVDEAPQPAWFSEGIAELLSTFEYSDGKVNWAKPLSFRLASLRREGPMPLREFLAQPAAIFDRDTHTDRFYAQSWAFTHFLLYSGEGTRSALLRQFLQAFREQSGDAAIELTFGRNLDELERQFRSYLGQRSWRYTSQPGTAVVEPAAPRPASQAQVEVALGRLALGSDRRELARAHASRATALDDAAPGGHEILAYLAIYADQPEEAAMHAAAALQRGSHDTDMHTLRADALRGANGSASELTDLYRRAIHLNPRRQLLYTEFTYTLLGVQPVAADDATLVQQGMTAFPADDWLRVGGAMVDHGAGRRTFALQALEHTLREDSTLDTDQRGIARQLRRGWHIEEMNQEMRAAFEREDFPAARATLERYRGLLAGDAEAEQYLRSVEGTVIQRDLLLQLSRAQRAGRTAEARRVASQLLVLPDLPQDLRNLLERLAR